MREKYIAKFICSHSILLKIFEKSQQFQFFMPMPSSGKGSAFLKEEPLIREGFQMSPFYRLLAAIAVCSILTTNVYCAEEMPVLFLDGQSHVELPKNLFDRTGVTPFRMLLPNSEYCSRYN